MKDKIQYLWMFIKIKFDKYMIKWGYYPVARYAENPLMKYPRNIDCFCGARVKSKNCCLPKQPRIVTLEQAQYLAPYMMEVEKRQGVARL